MIASACGRGYGTQRIYLPSSEARGAVSDMPSPDRCHRPAWGELIPVASKDERFMGTLQLSNPPILHETPSLTYTFTTAIALERAQLSLSYPPSGLEAILE